MEQFLSDLATPYFLLTAVLLNLLINLASGYIKDFLDRTPRWVAGMVSLRARRASPERAKRIKRLAADPHLQTMQMGLIIHTRLKSLGILMLSVLLMTLPSIAPEVLPLAARAALMMVALLVYAVAARYVFQAQSELDMLEEATS
ncbi:MAG TPA: hypothetical protein DCP20_01270 [Coriobacteriia bacterium]|nr:hypothetical protein [Coriobacteriia bacterium]